MHRLLTLAPLALLGFGLSAGPATAHPFSWYGPNCCAPVKPFYTPPDRPFYVAPVKPFYTPPGRPFYMPPNGPFYTSPNRPFYVPPPRPSCDPSR